MKASQNVGKPGAAGSDEKVVLPRTEARQGVTGHNVRYVLLVGTVGVVVLFGLVYIFSFS
jgi:hypothetical protein